MRIGVLASGTGTNLEAILEARLPVVVVVADRPCRALQVARRRGRHLGARRAHLVRLELRSVGVHPRGDRRPRGGRRRARRDGRFHDHPRQALRRPVAGTHPQHPPFSPALVSRRPRRARCPRGRREDHRLHGAHRDGRARRRADRGPDGRRGASRRHRRVVARAHQGGRARALPGRDPNGSCDRMQKRRLA